MWLANRSLNSSKCRFGACNVENMYKVNILNTELFLDQTALNFFNIAFKLCPNPTKIKCTKDDLSDYRVVWDGESVKDLADGSKISADIWQAKLQKINKFKDDFLSNKIQETTILIVKDSKRKERLIIDGIHRSVGFYKALLEDKNVEKSTNFQAIFFESGKINEMGDYQRIFGQ